MKAENWLNKEAVKRKVAVERNVIAGNRFNVKIKVRARYNTEQAKTLSSLQSLKERKKF